MYTVLIAEDELLVRLGLKNTVDWDKFELKVIADVSDGKAAWEVYDTYKPDLVVTDLKMPIMSGMELIEKIRENDRETKIIILSCLEEFDLVRKAMALGVSDYISKLTATGEEIENILKKTIVEINKRDVSDTVRLSSLVNTDMIKEKLFKECIIYNNYSYKELESQITKFKFRLNPARLILCIIEIDHFASLAEKFKEKKGRFIKSSMMNILNELLAKFKRGEAFCEDDSHYILIFSFYDICSEKLLQQELSSILSNIKNTINAFLNSSVTVGISSVQNGYTALDKIYNEAAEALKKKFIEGTDQFLTVNSINLNGKLCEKVKELKYLPGLSKIVDSEGIKEYNERIDNIIHILPEKKEQIQELFYQLFIWTASSLHLRGEDPLTSAISYGHKIYQYDTLEEIIEEYERFVSELSGKTAKSRVMSKQIFDAVNYIQNYYGMDISLQQAAEYVNLNPTYLSNLFKKELRISFIEYLNGVRIEKAKRLLLETYLKSYEIAEKVGFSENTYFSKLFKKLTGTSPNEFRKQWMKDWKEEAENEKD